MEKKDNTVRIGRYLSMLGVCSRREAADFLKTNEVLEDGRRITELNHRVTNGSPLTINGKALRPQKIGGTVLLNKPPGYICSHREYSKGIDRPQSIFRLLPKAMVRYYYAGRLDVESRGLVVLSNDGDLIYRLSHPKFGVEKRYIVKTTRPLSVAELRRIAAGVWSQGDKLKPDNIKPLQRKPCYEITLHEGKNREIRRIFEVLNIDIVDLQRVSLGPYSLGDIKEGKFIEEG